MVLAQYRPQSLIEHIGSGAPWDLNRDFTGGVKILTPYKARNDSDWFAGTADAVQQNFGFIKNGKPDLVLILSGDHIYRMDYRQLIRYHLEHNADMNMAAIRVPLTEGPRFGILGVNPDLSVNAFVEKPSQPPSDLANMGVYLFDARVLDRVLWEDHSRLDSTHDFGKDILPRMVAPDDLVPAVETIVAVQRDHGDRAPATPRIASFLGRREVVALVDELVVNRPLKGADVRSDVAAKLALVASSRAGTACRSTKRYR